MTHIARWALLLGMERKKMSSSVAVIAHAEPVSTVRRMRRRIMRSLDWNVLERRFAL